MSYGSDLVLLQVENFPGVPLLHALKAGPFQCDDIKATGKSRGIPGKFKVTCWKGPLGKHLYLFTQQIVHSECYFRTFFQGENDLCGAVEG